MKHSLLFFPLLFATIVATAQTQTFTVNGVSFKMVYVQGGTFQMGSSDLDADDHAKPIHKVTLSSYYIGQTEVTQELWQAVMGESLLQKLQKINESGRKKVSLNEVSLSIGDKFPMFGVSWNDWQLFIIRLNRLTGKIFRMPTEAEWEYAARGGYNSKGYKYAGSNKLDDVAWYCWNTAINSTHQLHEVATKAPNELGIFDMSGNINEWCWDWYEDYNSGEQTNPQGPDEGHGRVCRGGNCDDQGVHLRVTYRGGHQPHLPRNGLRLALSPYSSSKKGQAIGGVKKQ